MKMKTFAVLACLLSTILAPAALCAGNEKTCGTQSGMQVSVQPWGKAPDGTPVELYTLTDGKGTTVRLSTFGATMQSLETPDRNGKVADIVLGFDNVEGYAACSSYQGAGIGRYGNRIGGAAFTIDGESYKVTANEKGNCLHGGKPGYDKVVWCGKSITGTDYVGVEMHRLSPDGEQGFPGNLDVKITFKLNDKKEIFISYEARTDKATTVNLTHHMYYNLTGDPKKDILGHKLTILADRITPVDAELIPTGEIVPVKGTPFDFTKGQLVGKEVDDNDAQLKLGGGYDHNLVFAKADGTIRKQCELSDPESGRVMEILTTEPAVQFYSGNGLGEPTGKGGIALAKRHGLCLETQHYPDSPNHPNFPSTILRPGELYSTTTVLRLSTK
jgi:aldose 1-epimerase